MIIRTAADNRLQQTTHDTLGIPPTSGPSLCRYCRAKTAGLSLAMNAFRIPMNRKRETCAGGKEGGLLERERLGKYLGM